MQIEMLEYIAEAYNSDKKFVVLMGARGSGKSHGTAQIMALKTFEKDNNILCIRKVQINSESQFKNIQQAIVDMYKNINVAPMTQRTGGLVIGDFKITKSPKLIVNLKTGNEIHFYGTDDPKKLTSATATNGEFKTLWVEEAYQIKREDFQTISESVGRKKSEKKAQYFLTFNPWNKLSWLYEDFVADNKNADDTHFSKSTYRDNPFFDLSKVEEWKKYPEARRKVVVDGEWGTSEGLVFERFEVIDEMDYEQIQKLGDAHFFAGLDFGYSNDPTALIYGYVDFKMKNIYVLGEDGAPKMNNSDIAKMIHKHGLEKSFIYCDSSDPRTINELRFDKGLEMLRGAKKGAGSIEHGIQVLQEFGIVIDSKCKNFISEINNYVFSEKQGEKLNKPIDKFNHWIDALRYAIIEVKRRER